ncbi:MAG TPA: polysaccharide biosynthesis/export family protein [Flavobacterium sp.]|nr:polysaccharide biosynthesis/export family protein [Flavobacterium sp.]
MGLLFMSCSSRKQIQYFSDIDTQARETVAPVTPVVQVNDLLSITISSSTPELAAAYNIVNPDKAELGYLVAADGTITLPVLGTHKVAGLTFAELDQFLRSKLITGGHLADPVVIVRRLNAKFTVLGEVTKPGTYSFTEQNITLLQALGYAGDLTIYGKRSDILIIREENGLRTYTTVDLTSRATLTSNSLIIKPNDVIYVNPNDTRVKSAGYIGGFTTLMTTISVALSTVVTILVLSK